MFAQKETSTAWRNHQDAAATHPGKLREDLERRFGEAYATGTSITDLFGGRLRWKTWTT